MKESKTIFDSDDEEKCPLCNGKEWIQGEEGFIECECRQRKINFKKALDKLKKSGVSDVFAEKTLSNFDSTWHPKITKAGGKVKNYISNFTNNKGKIENSVGFCGQTGSGKTHLAIGISSLLLKKGIGVMYFPYESEIKKLKQMVMDEKYQEEIEQYKTADVLLIDDLFKETWTNADVSIIFEIINYRYFNAKPIIFTTEKSLMEIIERDEALGSRLLEMCFEVVSLKGKELNYRLYKNRFKLEE